MKTFFLLCLGLALSGCRDANAPSDAEVRLTLTKVDGKALPFSVGILRTATTPTAVTGGTLTGTNQGPSCTLILTITPGDPVSINILPCTINKNDVIDYPIDLGSNTGYHSYRFE